MTDDAAYRLPRTVEPTRYEITLTPNLVAATFSGEESISLTVHEAVEEIVLNAAELAISTAELLGDDGAVLTGRVLLDEPAERAHIHLSATAMPGQWTLHLRFAGTLNDKLRGFYRSTFTDEHGATQTIATTQFEATDARRAFPCWDEPDLKATFKISLSVEPHLFAVSNAAVALERNLPDGRRLVEFAETMVMSTYLVAFVVGPLVATKPVDVDGVPLRVVCVPGKEHLAEFAIEIGTHALRFFSRYFGIPYPSDKLDLLALPDFAMGAMENLGAVTFRETLLLIDAKAATQAELERVADVVAHEIAHMWFGDLVTMKWWNGIWLNEAFATFMELLCVDAFRPEWDRWTSFGIDRAGAMTVDALGSTRPIEFPVHHPREAEQMFDALTYQKGGGVLRMLEQYLGPEPFRRGIAAYIATHSHANTETTDLWDALEGATGEPVRAMMDSWIYQGGHPVVTVASDGATLTLEQRRFRFQPDTDDASRWRIPIMLRTRSDDGTVDHHKVLLSGATDTVRLPKPATQVVLNDGGSGVYRSHYSSELLRSLTSGLRSLAPLERYTLVVDTTAAMQGGLTSVPDVVELLRTVAATEDDPSVWSAIIGALGWLERVTEPDERGRLWAFARSLLRPAFDRLGWSAARGEGDRTRDLRATLVVALALLGNDDGIAATAAELHALYLADRSSIDRDVAGVLPQVVGGRGDATDYAMFLRQWRAPVTPQEELRYLYSLGEFRVPDLIERTLDLALTEVRSQNAPFLLSRLLANRAGGWRAWEFIKAHWDELRAKLPENLVDRMLEGALVLSAVHEAADVKAFVAAHPIPSRARTVEQLLERLDVAVAFRRHRQAELVNALTHA